MDKLLIDLHWKLTKLVAARTACNCVLCHNERKGSVKEQMQRQEAERKDREKGA